jgi:Mce-associated membrane protein
VEAVAAEAEARAEAARARANELRRKLESASADDTDNETDETTEATTDGVDEVAEPTTDQVEEAAPAGKRRLRLVGLKGVAAALVVLVIAGLLSATGWMLLEHRKATAERHRTAEYAAAARQGVVNLMSMDYTQAKESVQRVIDDSIGKFKTNFEDSSQDLIKALQDSKMVTKVTVNDTAVEAMDEETATVLVAATSHREGPNAPKEDQQPRVWRVVITMQRDGGQIKMSDVEFA